MNTSTSVKHAAVSKKLKKGILSQQNNILSISSLPGYILFIPHLLFLFQLSTHEPVHNV